MPKPRLVEELRRRHVWRAAIAYAVAGWLLVQVATQVFPFFDIPSWAVRLVVILIAIGFPVALMLAWVYEITPEGIRRTTLPDSPDARSEFGHRQIGRRLDAIIVTVLVLALGLLGWQMYAVRHAPAPAVHGADVVKHAMLASPASVTASTQPIRAKSIAVLPFENLSGDKDNAYFVAGMQDLILTKLADIGELKVIARTSTARYASRPDDLKTIGQQLGVATVLEGSVQKAGREVLINVQLIDVGSNSHLWAQSYQRTLDNIFGVEGEVAQKIAAALQTRLTRVETASLEVVPTQNRAAYDLFLRAEYLSNRGNVNYDSAGWKVAIPLYQQAVDEDPDFALAWARLSWVESHLAWFGGGGEDVRMLSRRAREAAERAVRLQPGLAAAQRAIGYNDYWCRADFTGALQAFDEVLRLKPNDVDALAARGWVLRRQGHFEAAIASLQRALILDPRNSFLTSELGMTYMLGSRYLDAENTFQRALAIDPDNRNAMVNDSNTILFGTGDVLRALAAVAGDAPQLKLQRVTLLTYQRKYREALALLESIPESPDTFAPVTNGPKTLQQVGGTKAQQQAYLYRLMGDAAAAKRLYAGALPAAREQLELQDGINLAAAWQAIAFAELGLGHVAASMDAIGKAQAIDDQYARDKTFSARDTVTNAALYVQAGRRDLAMPLLARALASSNIGYSYSPVLLWLDPAWDPIRDDPGFKALLEKYVRYRPALTPAEPTSTQDGGPRRSAG